MTQFIRIKCKAVMITRGGEYEKNKMKLRFYKFDRMLNMSHISFEPGIVHYNKNDDEAAAILKNIELTQVSIRREEHKFWLCLPYSFIIKQLEAVEIIDPDERDNI